jgi:iron complex outermembrane receptor protein
LNKSQLKSSVIAVALTLPISQFALAQEQAAVKPVATVIVTGTNLKKIDSESSTPLQVIKQEDIKRIGVSTVKELLETLTSSTGSLSDIGGSNSFAGGASAVSLRGLGKQSTLLLLNSRRVAPYALADYNEVFTNLDTLPLDAVQEVQILRNGGSAVYGSDAVAGVINVITRSDYQGVTINANHQRSTKNGVLHNSTASITGGIGDIESDGFNVLGNIEFYKRKGAVWRQLVDDVNPRYGDKFSTLAPGSGLMFGNRGLPSTFSYPGNILGNPQAAISGCTTKNAAGLCVFDRYSRFEAQPDADRVNSIVSGTMKINSTTTGFAELLYSHTKTDYTNAFSTYDSTANDVVWGNPITNGSNIFSTRYLPATHPLNQTGDVAPLRYRFADSGAFRNVVSDQYRALAGVRGTLEGSKWDWETAFGIMGGKTKDRSRGAISDAGFKQVIGDYTNIDSDGNVLDPNFFNHDYKIGQKNSDATLNTLFPESGYVGKITQTFIDGKVTGQAGNIGGRPINVAVGGDIRHETFRITPQGGLLTGDVVGNGVVAADASRTNEAVFTEASFPVAEKVELVGALRVDKFKDVKAHASPKLAARWEVTPAFLLRGTVESGFRAPNLTESAQSTKFAFDNGITDPKRCDAASALATALRAEAAGLPASNPKKAIDLANADIVEQDACAGGAASIVHNNPNLKPETSHSSTVGFVLEPVKGTSLSLDYWRIERKDEIKTKSTQELLQAEDSLPAHTIERQATDNSLLAQLAPQYNTPLPSGRPISSINGMFENTTKTRVSGVDVGLNSRINTPVGRVDLNGNMTYLIDLRNYAPTRNTTGAWGDNLSGRYGVSKIAANMMATLKNGAWSNSLRVRYYSGTVLQDDYFDDTYSMQGCVSRKWSARECRVAGDVRWDYNLSYSPIKNLTLGLNVRNLFDVRPPIDLRAVHNSGGGVIPQDVADVSGRVIRIGAEYKF